MNKMYTVYCRNNILNKMVGFLKITGIEKAAGHGMAKAHRLHVLIPLTNAWYALVYRTVAMCETIRILLHNEYEARYAPSSVGLPKAECRMAVHSLYTGYLSSYSFRSNPRVVPGSYQ